MSNEPPRADPASLHRRKAELRRLMAAVRQEIPPGERAARAVEIERRLFDLPETSAAATVLAFHSFGLEVPTGAIMGRLLADGKRVLLPAVQGDRMDAAEYRPGQAMARAAYGVFEPVDRTPADPRDVDLVVAPGLAFDRRGDRLGYGGGYFDGFLHRVDDRCFAVGICFHEQVVEAVPSGPGDVPVDAVVTDREVIRTTSTRR